MAKKISPDKFHKKINSVSKDAPKGSIENLYPIPEKISEIEQPQATRIQDLPPHPTMDIGLDNEPNDELGEGIYRKLADLDTPPAPKPEIVPLVLIPVQEKTRTYTHIVAGQRIDTVFAGYNLYGIHPLRNEIILANTETGVVQIVPPGWVACYIQMDSPIRTFTI